MRRAVLIPVVWAVLATGAVEAQSPQPRRSADTPAPEAPPAPPANAVQLDHVVAAIGTNVILESDVRQEMRFSALEPLRVLPGENTPARALRRLIDRSLILEQMKEQQQPISTAADKVTAAIERLRGEIPACRAYDCKTETGWNDFLRSHELTPEMVETRWSQRMAILRFIDLRFRSGIRISNQQVADYYEKHLVPALRKEHETAPPLAEVSSRIHEVVLQQQISNLFEVWLNSLRDEGNIRIVDPAYSADLVISSGDGSE